MSSTPTTPPPDTLFPYTTLFRSGADGRGDDLVDRAGDGAGADADGGKQTAVPGECWKIGRAHV
jgi:hypothetical protein